MCNWKKKGGHKMSILEILKNMDTKLLSALIGFAGVIIGTMLTIFSTLIVEYFRAKREDKKYSIQRKETIYCKSCELIDKITIFDKDTVVDSIDFYKKITEEFISIKVQLKLFAPNNIFEKFKEIIKEFGETKSISDDKEQQFIKILKKDLNIKD